MNGAAGSTGPGDAASPPNPNPGPAQQAPQPQPQGFQQQAPQHFGYALFPAQGLPQGPAPMFPSHQGPVPGAYAYQGISASVPGAFAHQGPSFGPYQGNAYSAPVNYQGGMQHPQQQAGASWMSNPFMAPAGQPFYNHYPAPTPKRGRPLGSKNKRRSTPGADEEDDNYEPPSTRSKHQRASETQPARQHPVIPLPDFYDFEIEIPGDKRAACSRCSCTAAMFLVKPCGHYGWCGDCIKIRKKCCLNDNVPESCYACKKEVEAYVKYFRSVPENSDFRQST